MSLGEKLSECTKEFQALQLKTILDNFKKTEDVLAKKSTAFDVDIAELKASIEGLKAQYSKKNIIIKQAVKGAIKELEEKLAAAEVKQGESSEPLEVTLLLNNYNGSKELIMPIRYKDCFEYKKESKKDLAGDIYLAARGMMLAADMSGDELDWNGYVRIVSENVSKNPEMNQLSAESIEDEIRKNLSAELKKAGIEVKVELIKGINTDQTIEPENKKAMPKETPTARDRPSAKEKLSFLADKYACVSLNDAAQYLGITPESTRYKIKNGEFHALQNGHKCQVFVPMHELITYMCSHMPVQREKNSQAKAFEHSLKVLSAEDFEKYKKDVSEVLTVLEASEFLGIGRSAVQARIDKGTLHGVSYQNKWYLPKAELELVKDLKDSGF